MSKHKVLIVEDDNVTRLLIARILAQELDVVVSQADCAEQAERELDATPFDLVLLDLLMPGNSGADVLQQLRHGGGPNQATPVIVASVLGDEEMIARCRALGANHYLVKPIRRETLLEAARQHLPDPATATPAPADAGKSSGA